MILFVYQKDNIVLQYKNVILKMVKCTCVHIYLFLNARTHIPGGVGCVTKSTFVFVLETGIPAIRLSFILA